jgi:chromosome segregation ATPase
LTGIHSDAIAVADCLELDPSAPSELAQLIRLRLGNWMIVESRDRAETALATNSSANCVTLRGEIYTQSGEISNFQQFQNFDANFFVGDQQKKSAGDSGHVSNSRKRRVNKDGPSTAVAREESERQLERAQYKWQQRKEQLASKLKAVKANRAKSEQRLAKIDKEPRKSVGDEAILERKRKENRERKRTLETELQKLRQGLASLQSEQSETQEARVVAQKGQARSKQKLMKFTNEMQSERREVRELKYQADDIDGQIRVLRHKIETIEAKVKAESSRDHGSFDAEVTEEFEDDVRALNNGDSDESSRRTVEQRLLQQIADLRSELTQSRSTLSVLRSRVDVDALERLLQAQQTLDQIRMKIEESQSKAQRTLADIQSSAASRYAKTAQVLRKAAIEFPRIFRRLTGGRSDAALVFTDDLEGLFLDGIILHVRPDVGGVTHSRWRPFSGLSGGQQAITALSLSVALQACVPSPLYLFDEIDASLDTHAVSRVTDWLLEQHQQNVQMLVVSLRPQMVLRLPQLLGVYHASSTSSLTAVAKFD